ncbi:MAG TPA: DUF106 domain-containing protein [Nanoarchaeota archaeon]|nr:DUF106 domain-containing protein [Nanoarchaeota archaeon]
MITLLEELLTKIFLPILGLPFSLSIFLITFLLMCISSLIYYFSIDKQELRYIRERIEELQKELKKMQKENPKKAEEIMKEVFQLIHKRMMLNIKPMLVTIFIAIIFIPWISSISFIHIELDDSLNGVLKPKLFTSQPKEYQVKVENNLIVISLEKENTIIKVSEKQVFKLENNFYRVNKIDLENKIIELGLIVKPPFPIPFFSYGFGWLMWYIICSSLLFYTFNRILGI